MMQKLLFFLCFLIGYFSYAQEDAWVYLKDKPNATFYLSNPLQMLSKRALKRRIRQNIPLDLKDVPIEANYYQHIKNSNGITVLASSKWLNAIHVQGSVANINHLKTTFFIDFIDFSDKSLNAKSVIKEKEMIAHHQQKFKELATDFDYGDAANQITMLQATYLHEQGFTGKGMEIAILDAGFPNVDINPAFQRLRENQQILGGFDFVHRSQNFYTGHYHGAFVLSDIGGYLENRFVGTAPDAKFYLFITEDVSREVPLEESLWVEAAEKADSLGVDVINTSLGYTTFDNPRYNHTYADMNGKTAFISKGAAIAASRGMLLVNAAGNSGRSSWHYIGAPADAEGVLSIGAVNKDGNLAQFSSRGPTADNRIKPDVMAQGQNAYIINTNGFPRTASGTSFASPIMAGAVACFWQAFPKKTATEIKEMIRESGNYSDNPNNDYGYGIPNFKKAYETFWYAQFSKEEVPVFVYPNPVKDDLFFRLIGNIADFKFTLYNLLGKKIIHQQAITRKKIPVSYLSSGIYFLRIDKGNQHKIIKMIKK